MDNTLKEIFGVEKPIIGMAHFLPLPGNYLYDDSGVIKAIENGIIKDIEELQAGGVDSIMFCNEHDRPYSFKAGPAAIATMAYVIANIKSRLEVPFGVDVLWGPIAALGSAVLGAVAAGKYGSIIEAAGKMVKFKDIITPDMDNHNKYKFFVDQYKKTYLSLKDSMCEIDKYISNL